MKDDEVFDEENEDKNENENVSEQDEPSKSSISADLIRGHINTIILRTLDERDKYGYEIINEIEEKSHGQYTLKQPTLYSALKRLENQGYIKAYWKTDDVTLGGRRKYFTLTELGREFSEKNQSEWEYSRTVIDSLISDRSFDFSQPAPTPVDFKILKQSVTRVRTGEKDSESEELAETEHLQKEPAPYSNALTAQYGTQKYEQIESSPVQSEYSGQTTQEIFVGQPQPPTKAEEQPASDRFNARDTRSEEEKRTTHENFLRLISSAREPEEKPEEIVPNSDEIDTEKLIYNLKPETERDYKKLVNNIFNKAIKRDSGARQRQPQREEPQPAYYQPFYQSDAAAEKARADGLKVNTSGSGSRTSGAVNTTFNKGGALFLSSLIICLLMLAEFVICLLYRQQMNVPLIYPIVILIIALLQLIAFGGLYLYGYGKGSARPTSHNYISVCVILTIIAVLIICLTGFLLNVNLQSVSDIMAKVGFPALIALNLTFFAFLYYIFSKRK